MKVIFNGSEIGMKVNCSDINVLAEKYDIYIADGNLIIEKGDKEQWKITRK